MAGDWIRFRSELWTHPRFLALCQGVREGVETALFGTPDARHETDALAARRERSRDARRALADLVMGGLLRVWSAVNSHAKVDGDDAVFCPMSLGDLDDLAGYPGFGRALEAAGWVRSDCDNYLRFPNFCEYNEPAALRKPAKTNAARCREYREKLRQLAQAEQPKRRATRATRSDAPEKRREENTTTTSSSLATAPEEEVVCPEVPEAAPSGPTEPPSPVVMTFPTVGGKAKTWDLTEAHLAKYVEAWPNLDVRAAFVQAKLYVENNPRKQKTPRGMPQFLSNWLEIETRKQAGRPAPNGRAAPLDRQGLLDYFKDL